jgi:hypothetical protein
MEAGGIGDETGDGFFATAAGSGGWQVVCGAVVGFVGSIGGGEVVLGGWFVVEGVGWCRHGLDVGVARPKAEVKFHWGITST